MNRDTKMIRYDGAVRKLCLVTTLLLGSASGFATVSQIVDQGAVSSGRGNAGEVAAADDLATMYFNPAGLSLLDASHGTVAVHALNWDVDIRMTGEGSFVPGDVPYDPGTGPTQSDQRFWSGAAYFSPRQTLSIGDRNLRWGVAFNSPFGVRADYGETWVGRYHAGNTELETYALQPTIALEMSDSLSLGFGVAWVHVEAEQSAAIDFGAIGALSGMCPVCVPGSSSFDGVTRVSSDDDTYSWTLGAVWSLSTTKIGIAYRSKIPVNLKGEVEISSPFAPTTIVAATSSFDLPDTITFGIAQEALDGKLNLLLDVSRTNWGRLKRISVETPDQTAVEELSLKDSWRYSAGLDFDVNSSLSLRAGITFDETASTGTVGRSVRTGDEDNWRYSLGLTWRFKEVPVDVHGFVTWIDMDRFNIDNVDQFGHRLEATSRWSWTTAGFGITWRPE